MSARQASAALLSLVLVFQMGCDFWCYQAGSGHITNVVEAFDPPCHGSADTQQDGEPEHRGKLPSAEDCIHPRAVDDNSKLQGKVAQATHQMAFADVYAMPHGVPIHEVMTVALPTVVFDLPAPSVAILRI